MTRSPKPNCAPRKTLLLLVLPAALLTACATPSIPSAPASPALPSPPPLSQPIPPQSYSGNVRALLQTWQQKLMATQVMSGPTAKPGQ